MLTVNLALVATATLSGAFRHSFVLHTEGYMRCSDRRVVVLEGKGENKLS